jgi:hypothetical protein
MVLRSLIHACGCAICRAPGRDPRKARHRQLNLVLAHLDERQRRWVAALEAMRLGYGGLRMVATITGLAEKTIRRGRRELQGARPRGPQRRVRRAGAGRPRTEKKFHSS